MTDKKHINDSLKNSDKNFNENCTHNKEQIIIDGCNVLKCRYYQYKTLKDCEMRYPESGDCEIGLINYLFNGNLDMEKLCVDNPNCIFKQLARKTQECKKLNDKIIDMNSIIEDAAINLGNKDFTLYDLPFEIKKLKKECEQKDKETNELHLIIDRLLEASGYDKNISNAEDFEDVYADINYKLGLIDDLKQECEELKIKLIQKDEVNMFFNTPIEGWDNDPCGICPHKAENEELKKEIINKNEKIKELRFSVSDLTNRLCYLNAEKSFRIVDLEQTLDGIEKELKEDIYCENQECGCDDFEECLKCTKEHILDIINKAKGEGNAV